MSLSKRVQLYKAACRAGYCDPKARSLEEWWDRVSDYGLDDAQQALYIFIDTELARLRMDVVNTARKYRESARVFQDEADKALDEGIDPDDVTNLSRKINEITNKFGETMRRDGKLLDEAIDRLIQFEEDYALDSTGKPLERGGTLPTAPSSREESE